MRPLEDVTDFRDNSVNDECQTPTRITKIASLTLNPNREGAIGVDENM